MGDAAGGRLDCLRDENRDGPNVRGHGLGPETRGGFRGSTTLSPENGAETIPVVQRGRGVVPDVDRSFRLGRGKVCRSRRSVRPPWRAMRHRSDCRPRIAKEKVLSGNGREGGSRHAPLLPGRSVSPSIRRSPATRGLVASLLRAIKEAQVSACADLQTVWRPRLWLVLPNILRTVRGGLVADDQPLPLELPELEHEAAAADLAIRSHTPPAGDLSLLRAC